MIHGAPAPLSSINAPARVVLESTMSESEQSALVARNNMRGALVALLVAELKRFDVWQKADQLEQDKLLQRLDEAVAATVAEAVRLIASDERPYLLAKVKGVAFKAGVEAQLVVDKTNQYRHDLSDHVGQEVLIVMPYGDRYQGANSGVKSEPNNKAMFADDGTPLPDAAAPAAADAKPEKPKRMSKKQREAAEAEAAAKAGNGPGGSGWRRDDHATQMLLLLVSHSVPLDVLATWTDEQVRDAEQWANDVHYAASDNDVKVGERPEHLAAYQRTAAEFDAEVASGAMPGNADTSHAGQLAQAIDGLSSFQATDTRGDPLLTQEGCARFGIDVPIDAIERWGLETLMRVENWIDAMDADQEAGGGGDPPAMPSELMHFWTQSQHKGG